MMTMLTSLRTGYRGLLLALTVALCAGFLSDHYGAPVMLFALLIGMAFNFLADHPLCKDGVDFAARNLLRLGVALLGFRLSLADVEAVGLWGVAVVLGLVAMTVVSGLLLAPLFGRSRHLGLLTGGAVGICGASAALALAAVMPQRPGFQRDVLFTVVAVTTLSTVAMVLYPLLFDALGYSEGQIGFLIGATIHDVAQVVGAGYSVGETAGDQATLTKLIRVLMLPLAVLAFSLAFAGRGEGARPGLPLFVIGFIALMLANSTGLVPEPVVAIFVETSRWLLIVAIAALGIKTSLASFADLGTGAVLLVVLQTLLLLAAAIALVSWNGFLTL
ncbi:YeiH family protein [Aestuariibius sp. 2305UL40-4]|uniref:YeiH family protein n=1 Tax=Aestuariibius violaceus TaxID=3234132 RepID=UPI00398E5898